MKQKNYFGRDIHPSDELVHWTETFDGNVFDSNEFQKRNDQLRADWDLVTSTPELKAAFARLLEAQRNIAHAEEAEREAGEAL